MSKRNSFVLLAAGLFLCAAAMKAEQPNILWDVKDGHEVNKPQTERLYLEACRWVEDRFGYPKQTLRPVLTIHVGESCPDPRIADACQTSKLGELYIPKWDEGAPGYVVQATLMSALLQLMSRQELLTTTRDLLADDLRNFMDAPAVAKRTGKEVTATPFRSKKR